MIANENDIRILVVDDSGFSRSIIIKELNGLGIKAEQIHQAVSGADALREIQETLFDLYILDIVMPEVDGITILKKIRMIQPNAKVVMCSGNSSDEIVKEVIKLGINAFVVKPIMSADLKKAVLRNLPSLSMSACSQDMKDQLIAKCHVCDSEMIEVSLMNTISFYCPHSCMQLGPIVHTLASQSELDKDYEAAKHKCP